MLKHPAHTPCGVNPRSEEIVEYVALDPTWQSSEKLLDQLGGLNILMGIIRKILFGPTCLPMSRTSAGRSVGDRYRAEVLRFRKAFEGTLFHLDGKRWAAPRFPSRYHKHPLASQGCGPPQAASSALSMGIFRCGSMFVSWPHHASPGATS